MTPLKLVSSNDAPRADWSPNLYDNLDEAARRAAIEDDIIRDLRWMRVRELAFAAICGAVVGALAVLIPVTIVGWFL